MKDFEKCTFLRVEYRKTSYYGNNSYWLNFLNSEGHFERGYTSPNASCGYTIQNYKYAEGKPIFLAYHYTKGGKCIIDSIQHNSPEEAEKYAEEMESKEAYGARECLTPSLVADWLRGLLLGVSYL